jgi:hypothetical protein
MALIKNRQTKIRMADGSLKFVDDIVTSEWVSGADNLPTNLRSIQNFVHNPPIECIRINDTLTVTSDQMFLGQDGNFYVYGGLDNQNLMKFNQGMITTLTHNSFVVNRPVVQVPLTMIKELNVGTILSGESSPIEVESIEIVYPLERVSALKDIMADFYLSDDADTTNLNTNDYIRQDTPVVRLALHRSGVLIANGYKCLGLPCNEWNYEENRFEERGSFEIVFDTTIGRFVKERS